MAVIGKGEGPFPCWPSAALGAYQTATDLGSASASSKAELLTTGLSQDGSTADTIPDCDTLENANP